MAKRTEASRPGRLGQPIARVGGGLMLAILLVRPVVDGTVYPSAQAWLITAAILAGGLTTVAMLLGSARAPRVSRLGSVALGGLLLWAGLSLTWSVDRGYSARQWFDLLAAVAVWWTAVQLGSEMRWRMAGLVALGIGLAATCAYGLYEYFVINEMVRREVFENMQTWIGMVAMDRLYSNRISSTFLAPTSFADYLATLLPLAVAGAVARRWTPYRGWPLAGSVAVLLLTGAAVVCLALTVSRGGWLAAATACGVLIVWQAARWVLNTRSAVVLVFAGILALAVPLDAQQERPSDGEPVATDGDAEFVEGMDPAYWRGSLPTVEDILSGQTLRIRATYWRGTWAMYRDHSWRGVGWGAWASAYPRYTIRGGYPTQLAHNNYLQVLAELGPVGLASFCLALASGLWSGWRHVRLAPTPRAGWLWAGATCSIVAFGVHSLTNFALYAPSVAWIAFAVLGVLHAGPVGTPAPTAAPRRLAALPAAVVALGLLFAWQTVSRSAQLVREARALARAGGLDSALVAARAATAQAPWDGEAAALAGRLMAQLAAANRGPGWAEAVAKLREAARAKPLDPWIRQSLADALWQAGTARRDPAMLRESVKQYAAASANYPVNPDLHATLGRAARALGDEATAVRELAMAEELRPDYREPMERQ